MSFHWPIHLVNQNHENKHQPITLLELGSHLKVMVVANENHENEYEPITLVE